jgi:hypothetical protein
MIYRWSGVFLSTVEARGIEPLTDSQPFTEKVSDSLAKSRPFSDFSEDEGDPKTTQKDQDNPEKPDRVRSAKRKPRND